MTDHKCTTCCKTLPGGGELIAHVANAHRREPTLVEIRAALRGESPFDQAQLDEVMTATNKESLPAKAALIATGRDCSRAIAWLRALGAQPNAAWRKLHDALDGRRFADATALLAAGGFDVHARIEHGGTLACLAATKDAPVSLLEALASIGAVFTGAKCHRFPDGVACVPLVQAARYGSLATVRAVLDLGADIAERSYTFEDAIAVAVRRRNPAIIELLVERGAVPPEQPEAVPLVRPSHVRSTDPWVLDRVERVLEDFTSLVTPDAIAHPEWPALIREVIARSRSYADVAEEVYGWRVSCEDDEGPLQDTWSDDRSSYVPAADVIGIVLTTPGAAAHPDWADLAICALETALCCNAKPSHADVRRLLEAGRSHPGLASVKEVLRQRRLD